MLEPIPQAQLIYQDRPQREPPRIGQTFGWHLPMTIEYPFELLIKILNCRRAQLVKDTPHLYPIVGMWVASMLRCDQDASIFLALLAQLRRVVVTIAQQIAHFGTQAAEQLRRHLAIGSIGGSQVSRQRDPDRRHRGDQM